MKEKSWARFDPRRLSNDSSMDLNTIVNNRMKYIGSWRGCKHDQKQIFANMSSFILLITCIAQTITLFLSRHDMQGAIDCFSVLTFTSMGFLKLTSLRTNRTKWQKLLSLVNDLEKLQKEAESSSIVEYETDDEDEIINDKMKDYTKKIKNVGSNLSCIYWTTAAIFVTAPFAEFAMMWFRKLPASYPHILPVWTPYEDDMKTYPLTILLELLGAVYCVGVHLAFDITSIGLMLFICGQFSSLRIKVQSIGGKGKSCFLSERRNLRAHERIIKCQQHHVALLKVNRILDSILKPLMGVYINLVTLTLCATAVQLTPDLSKVQMLSLVQYMCGCLTQLFLFCHFGDSVFHASNMGPAEGAFSTSWWCLDTRTRKELLILSIGMSRPLHLNAGWFHSLNRPSFLSILRTAYSFYTVLSKKRQN